MIGEGVPGMIVDDVRKTLDLKEWHSVGIPRRAMVALRRMDNDLGMYSAVTGGESHPGRMPKARLMAVRGG